MKSFYFLLSITVFAVFVSCVSVPQNAGSRELTLSGYTVSEADFGGTECWYAVDKYNYDDIVEKIRFQVGYFKNSPSDGFILYEDGAVGELAYFSRQGLDFRWDWGSNGENGYRYSFIIEPDGTGLYYDFSTSKDGTAKPRGLYKTHKF